MTRPFYIFYYILTLDWKKFSVFVKYVSQNTSRSKPSILWDVFVSVFRYQISILDYFYYRFYSLPHNLRLTWAGTGFMYEFQLHMNPISARRVLENKIEFLHNYARFVRREYSTCEELEKSSGQAARLLDHSSGRIVLKNSKGQTGSEVEVLKTDCLTPCDLVNYMHSKGYDLAEEYVVQHPDMNELSPSGLNTVRIITHSDTEQVDFLGARLRISVNSMVDNMAAGNLAAPVDISTGKVIGPGVYSDITKSDEAVHPVTGVQILGFQIPFWKEVCQMARDAALSDTRNRSVGWDIAITQDGPELIEGNHNWCKLLWQLPVKEGLKSELEKYL